MNGFRYEASLAPYACRSEKSRGRRYPEEESKTRNLFQRDRDRIIHSTAFRRLEYKTQVFVNHEGDHYRTRLTHSLEVAQIARSICRTLALHEDLAEAVALAHDLGHTPFGHSGQDALDEVMKPYGGFEHNRQSLRIVEKLERRYLDFPGLNLTYETREGIVKHRSPYDLPKDEDLQAYRLHEQATLEGQIGNIADEIAYNNHDVDDGLRAGMLNIDELRQLEIFRMHHEEVLAKAGNGDERTVIYETVRRMINYLIQDVIEECQRRIRQEGIETLEDVRAAKVPLVGFSEATARMNQALKQHLYEKMYCNYRVVRMGEKAKRVIQQLFYAYMENPAMLPPRQAQMYRLADGEAKRARVIADYIAGMTDRYALQEYDRLFDMHART